jgi:hypothetical protein
MIPTDKDALLEWRRKMLTRARLTGYSVQDIANEMSGKFDTKVPRSSIQNMVMRAKSGGSKYARLYDEWADEKFGEEEMSPTADAGPNAGLFHELTRIASGMSRMVNDTTLNEETRLKMALSQIEQLNHLKSEIESRLPKSKM